MIEDVFLALYLALLQPVLGEAGGPVEAAVGIATAFAFLLGLALVARYGARLAGKLISTKDEEIVIVVFVGVAEELGVSDAIGAFMIGLILGATAKADRLRTLTHPLRDAFGAIFFFNFGLSIDPGNVLGVAPQIGIAVLATVVLALTAGAIAARLHGYGRVGAANIGLTVLTRGEFSLILASLALAAGLDPRIGSFTAGYVLVLAVIGPLPAGSTLGLVVRDGATAAPQPSTRLQEGDVVLVFTTPRHRAANPGRAPQRADGAVARRYRPVSAPG